MATPRKFKSNAFEAIHSSASAMFKVGTIDKATMHHFDESCLAVPAVIEPVDALAVVDGIRRGLGDMAAGRVPANGASVGATMVAQGYAVDYRVFSGGAYVERMQKAAAQRVGLWGVDYEGMRQLAVQRAQMPKGCSVGTIKR